MMNKIIDWFVEVDKFGLFFCTFIVLVVVFLCYAGIDGYMDNAACTAKQGILSTVDGHGLCLKKSEIKSITIEHYRD